MTGSWRDASAASRAKELAIACISSSECERNRVDHLVPSVGWGGAERLACTLHRLAIARGWRSIVRAPDRPSIARGLWEDGGSDVVPRDPAERDGELSSEARSAMLRAWAWGARRDACVRGRASVVHAHLPFPDRFGAALVASCGRPLVASFQLLPEPGRPWSLDECFGWRSDNVLARVGPWLSRVIFVAPSEDDAARLRALLGPRARVERVANCPPLPRVREPDAPPFAWRPDHVRLLSVGRLVSQKGFDRLMDALAHESLASLAWQWVIAGAGPEEPALRAKIEARGLADRVQIATDRRASSMYPSADLVLCPSRSEGFPLVPMEAAEAGVLVVLSPIASHEELFAKAPEALLSRDERDWPAQIARWITDGPERERAKRRQREALAADPRAATADAYDALYRSALAGRGAGHARR